jgi:translation initiation factor IF-3
MASNPKKRNYSHKINGEIRATEIRLVGDGEPRVCSLSEALEKARSLGIDLVEISPNAVPPVCKIVDIQKFLYDQKKKAKKPDKVVVKEIRFTPNTDEHDFQFKLKHAIGFLEKGNKVKAFVFFRGREIVFREQGKLLLLRFAEGLSEYGTPEALPVLDGKKMFMWLKPGSKK